MIEIANSNTCSRFRIDDDAINICCGAGLLLFLLESKVVLI